MFIFTLNLLIDIQLISAKSINLYHHRKNKKAMR